MIGGTPVEIRDHVAGATVESVGEASGKKRWRATVAVADTVNQNMRIYPREVLAAEVRRLQGGLNRGELYGRIDHPGYTSAGSLESTVLIWRKLEMRDDGTVVGEFEVVEKHPKGAALVAQIEAGVNVGFSLYGYGSAHEPSESERRKYKIAQGSRVVIMDANYSMRAIDAVDDPSFEQARLIRESRGKSDADAIRAYAQARQNRLSSVCEALKNYSRSRSEVEQRAHVLLMGCRHAEYLEPELVHRLEKDGEESAMRWLESKQEEYELLDQGVLREYAKRKAA